MPYKFTYDWKADYKGPFRLDGGGEVMLINRLVEDGFFVYQGNNNVLYHGSGRVVGATDDSGAIIGRSDDKPEPSPREKRKAERAKAADRRRYDTQLNTLIRAQKKAARDVHAYVVNKWPEGGRVTYYKQMELHTGVVMYHDRERQKICIFDDDTHRKSLLNYSAIQDDKVRVR